MFAHNARRLRVSVAFGHLSRDALSSRRRVRYYTEMQPLRAQGISEG